MSCFSGSKQNYRSLAKALSPKLHRPVYTLVRAFNHPSSRSDPIIELNQDLRNHGSSPHAGPMDYATMAEDVAAFFKQHALKQPILLGHSMYVPPSYALVIVRWLITLI